MATTPLKSHGEHHITQPKTYLLVLLALTVLMISTVLISYVNLPAVGPIGGTVMNNLVAMFIAVAKALLVIMFFMGVKYSSALTKLFCASGFIMLAVMYGILGDYYTRASEPVQGWEKSEGAALTRDIVHSNEMDAIRQRADLPPAVELNVRPRQ